MDSLEIEWGGERYIAYRARLRRWFELSSIQRSVREAAEIGDAREVALRIYTYISAAVPELPSVEKQDWMEVALAYAELDRLNTPTVIVPMYYTVSNAGKPEPWDYEGRDWYVWAHALASAYGWSLEYIAEMSVDDAMALSQEIMTDDQLQKEWQWSLSEIAYPYDSTSKKSRFSPLGRPRWMLPTTPDIKKTKILKSFLPIGNVIDVSGVSTRVN